MSISNFYQSTFRPLISLKAVSNKRGINRRRNTSQQKIKKKNIIKKENQRVCFP